MFSASDCKKWTIVWMAGLLLGNWPAFSQKAKQSDAGPQVQEVLSEKVVLLLLPGLHPEVLSRDTLPNFERMRREGVYLPRFFNPLPERILQKSAAPLLAEWVLQTGTPIPSAESPLLQETLQQEGLRTAVVSNEVLSPELTRHFTATWQVPGAPASAAIAQALSLMQSVPELAYVQISLGDLWVAGAAHLSPGADSLWHPHGAYRQALQQADLALGQLLAGLPESATLIVTATCGLDEHGGLSPYSGTAARSILLAKGPNLKKGVELAYGEVAHLNPTVRWLLGLLPERPRPDGLSSRPMAEWRQKRGDFSYTRPEVQRMFNEQHAEYAQHQRAMQQNSLLASRASHFSLSGTSFTDRQPTRPVDFGRVMLANEVLLRSLREAALPAPLPADWALRPESIRQLMRRAIERHYRHDWKRDPNTRMISWNHGVLYIALWDAAQLLPDTLPLHMMRLYGQTNNFVPIRWNKALADNHLAPYGFLQLYQAENNRLYFDSVKAELDAYRQLARQGKERWWWCDALFMAPPTYSLMGKVTTDRSYHDFWTSEWKKTHRELYDPAEQLYFRDSSFIYRPDDPGTWAANGRKVFWGRGNAWVFSGLALALEHLPANHRERPFFEQLFRQMAGRLAGLQQPDGCWRASLLDPESFDFAETSATALYCHAFAWGIRKGLLPAEKYRPVAHRAWQALTMAVLPDGRVGYVQAVGDSPEAVYPRHTEGFGTGAFVLAATEMLRLAEQTVNR